MSEQTHWFVVAQAGERLDRFLADRLPELSRSQIRRLIADGLARVDQAAAKPSRRLEPGQRVTLIVPSPSGAGPAAERIPLDVVYEDRDVIVVNKPAGMVVHPGHGATSGTMVNALLAVYPALRSLEDGIRPGIVHRLDKETSGLTVIARTPLALQHLRRQFADCTVEKAYWALVRGSLSQDRGLIEAPIGRSRQHPTRMAIGGRAGRPARTAFEVLERLHGFTLVEAHPITGRTHQIRLHFAGLGHPIAGDRVYGDQQGAIPGLERHFLHAARLKIVLPTSGKVRELTAPLPTDLQDVLRRLRDRKRQ